MIGFNAQAVEKATKEIQKLIENNERLQKAKPDANDFLLSHKYPKNGAVITVLDVILQRGMLWNTVEKRFDEFAETYPEINFKELLILINKNEEEFKVKWLFNNNQKLKSLKILLSNLLEFKLRKNSILDWDALITWEKEYTQNFYPDFNKDPVVGKIPGIAFVTVQYFRMRCGRRTIKPDGHIKERLAEWGIKENDDVLIVENFEKIANNLNIDAMILDQLLW